ncbi:Trypsin-like peptidase domain-containing protein [Pseudonocardia thermophila]|uniref:Trypsin-like peptidase domain-containing protein n=1 Tax=Pseudonocardia thermophila TaxID=1848 RepID=A0A1M6RIR6_PSETH|nr:serine protease [Pseudonocardia thermophila]SHK32342.1 Trypsin-like peptidase domain-containing protein [Pseudonocardia thermophila]
MTRSRPVAVAVVTLATLLTTLFGAGTAQASTKGGAPPPSNPTERAVNLARPAVVRIIGSVQAVVEDPTGTMLAAPEPIEANNVDICTGAGINPDGFVATAGHCVDTETLEGIPGQLITAIVQRFLSVNPGVDPSAALDFAQKNLVVRGPTPGSPVQMQVYVVTGSTEAGQRPIAHQAEVVGYRPYSQGDVALLKIDVKNLPTLPLATDAEVTVGSDVIAIGFPARNDVLTDPSLEPSNKDGRISSKKTTNGLPFYELSAAMGPGMSGGPTVDLQGRLVGINSRVAGYDNESFSFVTTADTFAAFLSTKGVRAEAGRVDTLYRTALDDYYAGHYTQAVAAFDELLTISPGHPQAAQMRVAALGAREKYGDVPVTPSGSGLPFGLSPVVFWSIVAGGGALLLLLVGTLIARSRRRRADRTAAVPGPGTPPHGLPSYPPPGPVPYGGRPTGAWGPPPPVPVNGAPRAAVGTAILPGPPLPTCVRCAAPVPPASAHCVTCGLPRRR